MRSKKIDPDFLSEYEREADWAESHSLSQRTVKRYRELGLPYLKFGAFVWIPKRQGREWIAARVKRRNPRRPRQANTTEMRTLT